MIGVVGRIQTNSYTGKDGNKRISFDILAEEVEFCGSKDNETSGNIQQNNDNYYIVEENIEDDNLPF